METKSINRTPVILLGAGAHQEAGIRTAREVGEYLSIHEDKLTFVKQYADMAGLLWEDYEIIADKLGQLISSISGDFGEVLRKRYFRDNYIKGLQTKENFNEMIRQLEELPKLVRDALLIDESNIIQGEYLKPLIEYAKQNDVDIFTLNHDDLLERIGDTIDNIQLVNCWRNDLEDWMLFAPKPTDGQIALRKLHGSVDWEWKKEGSLNFVEIQSPQLNSEPAILIDPSKKESIYQPFGENYYKFSEALNNSHRWVIIGYGFGDAHLNKLLGTYGARIHQEITYCLGPMAENLQSTRKKDIGKILGDVMRAPHTFSANFEPASKFISNVVNTY